MTIIATLEKNSDYIINSWKSGKSMTKLGKEFNCNSAMIWLLLQNCGIDTKPKNRTCHLAKGREDEIVEMFVGGKSTYRISKDIGCTKTYVLRLLKNRGIDTSEGSKVDKNNMLKDKIDDVVKLYKDGHSTNKIGDIVGHSGSQVYKLLLKELKVDHLEKDIYDVDETYFDVVDTEYKAYILGWFYSDGTVDRHGKFRIQIQQEDKYILEWMKNEMRYEGPIYDIPPPKKFPHRKWQACLCVNRKSMAEKLINLGCRTDKSYTLTFPGFDIVPEHLFNHFLRGVFDGYGSVDVTGKRSSICCTVSFVDGLESFVKEKLNIVGARYSKKGKEHYNVSYVFNRKNESKIFLDYLYKDATIYLTRKHNRYLNYK